MTDEKISQLGEPCVSSWFMGTPLTLWNASKDTRSSQVHVSLYHPTTFSLSQQDCESILSQGIWIFAGMEDFSLSSMMPGVRSQVYQLSFHTMNIKLIEHYRLDNSKIEVMEVVAECLKGDWIWLKNQDVFLRRRNLRGIRLRCITGKESTVKVHRYDDKGKMIGLKDSYIGDLWNLLEMVLNFTCDWQQEERRFGGACNITSGICTGPMEYLQRKERDVAVGTYDKVIEGW